MKLFGWLLVFTFALLSSYWLFAIVVVTWVSYWYPAWWLFIVAVLVDGYFGGFYSVPVLTFGFGAYVLLVESLKIQLLETA